MKSVWSPTCTLNPTGSVIVTSQRYLKLGEAPCTHVPRTSLKSKIFLMSSTCFFHVSPLPVSPFSLAMALLYRPKSDRHWAAGGGRMRSVCVCGGGENKNKKGSIFCKNKKEKWSWAGSERAGVSRWCALRCCRTMRVLLQVTVSLPPPSSSSSLAPASPSSPPAVWTAAVNVTRR